MGEAMKKVDHLVACAFKSAMAFVLAVGLCPVAPAMAQEGVTSNEGGGTAAAGAESTDASTDGAVAGATGGVAGSKADGVQPGGVSGDGDAAAGGAGVGAPAQDAAENDGTGSGVSADAEKRLPWPMGKPIGPTMPPPRLIAGKFGAVASGWLTPKAA